VGRVKLNFSLEFIAKSSVRKAIQFNEKKPWMVERRGGVRNAKNKSGDQQFADLHLELFLNFSLLLKL
jgi:hypothetical protein